MALPKLLMVTLPGGKKVLYPSLNSFCNGFNANHSAVIKAINKDRPYKNLLLRYVGPDESIAADTQFYLGSTIGYECCLADYCDNIDLLRKIFNLVIQNKGSIPAQYRELLASLQVALNFLNVGEIII